MKKGFTLIEAILYLAIAGTVLYFISGFAFNAIFGKAKIQTIQEVNQNSRSVLDDISNSIGDALEINGLTSSVEEEEGGGCDATCVALREDLVAYWPLDGDTTDDLGTSNGTASGASPTTGKVGQAYVFDGSNDYVSLDNSLVKNLQSHSVSFWLYRTGNGTNYPRLFDNGAVNSGITITQNSTSRNILYRLTGSGSCSDFITTTSPIAANAWTHIVLTYDGSTRKIYADGSLAESLAGACTIGTGSGSTAYFGGDGSSSFAGNMDEVAIWDKALTLSEVSDLYNGGSGLSLVQ